MDDSTPKHKRPRIASDTFNTQIRHRDRFCLVGLFLKDGTCSEGLDCHHIVTRGSGGDDVEENGITLCRYHHNEVGRLGVKFLRSILSYYYGFVYQEN